MQSGDTLAIKLLEVVKKSYEQCNCTSESVTTNIIIITCKIKEEQSRIKPLKLIFEPISSLQSHDHRRLSS